VQTFCRGEKTASILAPQAPAVLQVPLVPQAPAVAYDPLLPGVAYNLRKSARGRAIVGRPECAAYLVPTFRELDPEKHSLSAEVTSPPPEPGDPSPPSSLYTTSSSIAPGIDCPNVVRDEGGDVAQDIPG